MFADVEVAEVQQKYFSSSSWQPKILLHWT